MNKNNNNERTIINQNYYKALSKFDKLSQDEIKELYVFIATGNTKAFNTLIESNLKLVIHFAKEYRNYINSNVVFDLNDLISEGNIGLIKAIPRFKPEMNIKFSYYASYYIKKYIQDFLMNEVNQIRIPQNKIIAESRIRKEIESLFQLKQNEVTEYDIEMIDKFLPSEINHFFNKPKSNRIENNELFIADETFEDLTEEIKNKINIALKYLTTQERTIIKAYFGINDETKLTIDELANIYDLSRQRINEIKLTALAKMKNKISGI